MTTDTKRPSNNPKGKPRKPIDMELVKTLASIHCTDEEIASVVGVSHETLVRRKREPEFAEVMATARAGGRASLRRMQWQAAQGGNITMMIFLGKNLLRQRDRFEDEEKDSVTEKAREVANALKAMVKAEKGEKAEE